MVALEEFLNHQIAWAPGLTLILSEVLRLTVAAAPLCLQCGSCWAFAATAAVESQILIKFKKKINRMDLDLSEQQVCCTLLYSTARQLHASATTCLRHILAFLRSSE